MGSQASSDGRRIVKTGGDRTKSEVKAMLKEVLRDYESSPGPDHRRADAPPLLHRRECGRAGRPAPDYGRSSAGHVVAILPGGPANMSMTKWVLEQENQQGAPPRLQELQALTELLTRTPDDDHRTGSGRAAHRRRDQEPVHALPIKP